MIPHPERPKGRTTEPLAVSELAEVAHCQRKVYLRALHGERVGAYRQHRRDLGTRVHRAAENDAPVAGTGGDSRCFIATCVFGAEAPETVALRRFRDAVLLPRRWGRLLVRAYYAAGPAAGALLRRAPWVQPAVRAVLRGWLRVIDRGGR